MCITTKTVGATMLATDPAIRRRPDVGQSSLGRIPTSMEADRSTTVGRTTASPEPGVARYQSQRQKSKLLPNRIASPA
jgi:hypothetical protein